MQQEKIYRRSDISTEKNGSFPGGKKTQFSCFWTLEKKQF